MRRCHERGDGTPFALLAVVGEAAEDDEGGELGAGGPGVGMGGVRCAAATVDPRHSESRRRACAWARPDLGAACVQPCPCPHLADGAGAAVRSRRPLHLCATTAGLAVGRGASASLRDAGTPPWPAARTSPPPSRPYPLERHPPDCCRVHCSRGDLHRAAAPLLVFSPLGRDVPRDGRWTPRPPPWTVSPAEKVWQSTLVVVVPPLLDLTPCSPGAPASPEASCQPAPAADTPLCRSLAVHPSPLPPPHLRSPLYTLPSELTLSNLVFRPLSYSPSWRGGDHNDGRPRRDGTPLPRRRGGSLPAGPLWRPRPRPPRLPHRGRG